MLIFPNCIALVLTNAVLVISLVCFATECLQANQIDGQLVDEKSFVRIQVVDKWGEPISARVSPHEFDTEKESKRGVQNTIFELDANVRVVTLNGDSGFLENIEAGPNRHKIRLTKCLPLTIQVVDEQSNPVSDAEVILGAWNRSQAIEWKANTNAGGRIQWEKCPIGRLTFGVFKDGFRTHWKYRGFRQAITSYPFLP